MNNVKFGGVVFLLKFIKPHQILLNRFLLHYDILFMELIVMEIKTGYLYHIKDEFFDVVNDDNLMQNHERGKKDLLILLLKIKKYYGSYQ